MTGGYPLSWFPGTFGARSHPNTAAPSINKPIERRRFISPGPGTSTPTKSVEKKIIDYFNRTGKLGQPLMKPHPFDKAPLAGSSRLTRLPGQDRASRRPALAKGNVKGALAKKPTV